MTKWIIAGLLLLVVVVYPTTMYYTSGEYIDVTVTDKEVKYDKGKSTYLVFTKDEVFKNTDNLFLMKFNSSDVQGQLVKDSTYTVKVYGWRVPFLSMYRNITYIKE